METYMNNLKTLLGPARVPFLTLPPVCVAVGMGTAYWQTGALDWLAALLVLLGAVCAHVSVNAFNEYFDYQSGLDSKTQRTPFSGGSGTLQAHPELAKNALGLAIGSLLITAAVGLYFTWLRGWLLLPLGLLGLLLIVTYTIWFVYNPIACLLAPGLGFGVLMVMGTHFVLTGEYTWTAFIASLVPTALVSNLLLLNQFPDVDADRTVGRRHFPVLVGRKKSALIFGALLDIAYGSVILGVILGLLPLWSLLALLTTPLAWRAWQGARKEAENIPALVPSMGMNVLLNIVTPLLLAIGLFIG
jgi:1,4-dihydroxy-2-naphthoate octaprenyltransferase